MVLGCLPFLRGRPLLGDPGPADRVLHLRVSQNSLCGLEHRLGLGKSSDEESFNVSILFNCELNIRDKQIVAFSTALELQIKGGYSLYSPDSEMKF